MRSRRREHLLEITSGFTAVTGTSLTANVAPETLNDGEVYILQIPGGIAFPVGLTGGEAFNIAVSGATPANIQVCDRRARNVLSERVRRYRVIKFIYTQDSVITQGATATPCFVAFEGITRIP